MKNEGAMPMAPAKKPKTISHIKVEQAENAGHMVEHNFEHYDHPSETHVFPAMKASVGLPRGHVLEHIAKVMKIPYHTTSAQPRGMSET